MPLYPPATSGSALTVKDEGSSLDTAVTSIDAVGAGITATNTSHAVTLTVPGQTFTTPAVVLGTAAAAGAASTGIRSDSTIVAFDATAPTTQAFGDSAATGSAAAAARRDHKHAMPATPTTVATDAIWDAAGDLAVGSGADTAAKLTKGSDSQVLTISPSTHVPVWATPGTGAVATDTIWDAAGDLAVGTGADTAAKLAKGSDSTVLTISASTHLPVWAAPAGGANVAVDTIWDAKGDLAAGTGADAAAKLTVGANDTILMADSAQSTGLKWVASQTPSTQAFSDAAAEGTADTYARGDHKHAMPASPGGGGALVLLEQHPASSSAALNFTSFISGTYDDYLVEGLYLVPATDGASFVMQVGTGGGPTYDTGSNYFNFGAGAATSLAIAAVVTNAADYGHCSFSLRLADPGGAKMKASHGTVQWHNGTNVQGGVTGGLWAVVTALTAVRFLYSSGNIATGVIRIYGIAKT